MNIGRKRRRLGRRKNRRDGRGYWGQSIVKEE